ncbi:MAG: HAD family phosphatase [Herpetosiphonaceae bacterium]|nr:HAD family phosphatase [Herpetosiphonaceae bacterium]
MPYRLLALDLDGTILSPTGELSSAVQHAIADTQARGVRVTLATGRTFTATLPFIKLLDIHEPVICYQGGLLIEPVTREIYHHAVMPNDLAVEAVQLLLTMQLPVVVFIDEIQYIAAYGPEINEYNALHPEGVHIVVEPNLAGLVATTAPLKLLFIAESDVVTQALAELVVHFAGRLTALRSHANFGELTPLGVSKGAALQQLAQRLGIAREEVIAIGDQENDLPMIRWAGLGLAMGNAIPEVQAAAKAVLPPVWEDGVAWAINTYLLTPE